MTSKEAKEILDFNGDSLSELPRVCGLDLDSIQLEGEFSAQELRALAFMLDNL